MPAIAVSAGVAKAIKMAAAISTGTSFFYLFFYLFFTLFLTQPTQVPVSQEPLQDGQGCPIALLLSSSLKTTQMNT